MRRQRMSRGQSKRTFANGAKMTHKKNIADRPMRGGIRL